MHKDNVQWCFIHQQYTWKLLVKRSPEAPSARWPWARPASTRRRDSPAVKAPEQHPMSSRAKQRRFPMRLIASYLHGGTSSYLAFIGFISMSKIGRWPGVFWGYCFVACFLLLKDVNNWNWWCTWCVFRLLITTRHQCKLLLWINH